MGRTRRVLVVCTGNSCRSVMAKGLLKKYLSGREIVIASAGVSAIPGFRPTQETIEIMAKEGIDVSGHLSQRLTPEMIQQADLILVMERWHKEQILRLVPSAKAKVFLLKEYANASDWSELEIPDPIAKPIEVYEKCLQAIKECVEKAVAKL